MADKEEIPEGFDFKVEFPDMDTCIVKKDSEYTWSEVFNALRKAHARKLKKISGSVLENNEFKGQHPPMFAVFPNRYKTNKYDHSYYGWFKDQNGIQHSIVLHDSTDAKGRPYLKGTIDYKWEHYPEYTPEKKAKGLIPDVFDPEKPETKPKHVILSKTELKEKYGSVPHKREEDNPLDSLPL